MPDQRRHDDPPAEGSLAHERFTDPRAIGAPTAERAVPRPEPRDDPTDLARHAVDLARQAVVGEVEVWVKSLEYGPWPGPSALHRDGSLARIARAWAELDEARARLRQRIIAAALPDDDEPPF